jgi:hypothetical protein
MSGEVGEKGTRRLVEINWPALWCLVFFVVGFVAGRLW